MKNKHLIVLAGPTASGKTATAIKLAKALNTVIISADSRQFYKELSIGTAAPTNDELDEVKHYFVHNLNIEQQYDVAEYEHDVLLTLNDLFKVHDTVVMTGGSGLFIDAVCKGLDDMPDVAPEFREKVNDIYVNGGIIALQHEVEEVDPEYYQTVDKQNPRRLQRALEVYLQTGKPYSSYRKNSPSERDFKIIKMALLWNREDLIERINRRVDMMIENGLVDEVKSVNHLRHLNSLNTVGYKEIFEYLDGKVTLDEAIDRIKINTRQYAKRQMTWLRKNSDYQWFGIDEFDKMFDFVKERTSE